MANEVTLTIDGKTVRVPQGTLIVDAAKKVGIDVPVFCYHPKMEPVGMCRMCLVEVGRPVIDRATNQPVLEADGTPKISFGPKLETACTTPVSEGMVVITQNKKVADARREVLEFILTSHPLDCPICDKGGECPLQNLTMGYGPGESRFLFDEKMHLAKHVPLGELIYLDRERCIQCARCVRFQKDLVDDPVIGFYQRGRSLEIVTYSDPGFDSYFSGNTTDICPVGALTTADFRFGARPWELKPVASICTHCPVGCNLTFNVRREAVSGGKLVIKRAMPRQNESVNEIWICDKGRFAYHYVESPQRLTQPLVRKNGELVPVSWDEALEAAAQGLKQAGENLVVLAGGRLSNEDLFNLRKLADAQNGKAVLYTHMGGGDLTQQVGLTPGSNLGSLGKGDAVLVIASDLHEEAPIWWMRLKAAAERGAHLVVAGARPTRLERYAAKTVRYRYGEELGVIQSLMDGAVPELTEAANLVVFYGSDGLDLLGTNALAQACATLLYKSGHYGRPNNGLVAVWKENNAQGAWDMGFHTVGNFSRTVREAAAVYIAAADPAGDDPSLAEALDQAGFVVVQELFLTETARRADVVFPAQSFAEREGTFTSGERRVQRFYPVIYPIQDARPDFVIIAQVARKLGHMLEMASPAKVFQQIASEIPLYQGLSYPRLAEVEEQWPPVGRSDLYYGGTAYDNRQGLGVALPALSQQEGWYLPMFWNDRLPERTFDLSAMNQQGMLWLVPFNRLYDHGTTVEPSRLLEKRMVSAHVALHPETARAFGLSGGEWVQIEGLDGPLPLVLDETLPMGVAFYPRSSGVPVLAPRGVKLHAVKAEVQEG